MLTRRHFALGLGAALLCRPFCDLLVPAARAEARRARRLVIFFSPNGTVPSRWRPSGGQSGDPTDFTFPAGSVLKPLADQRGDLLVLDGLDFIGVNNHEGGMAAMLTGGQGGVAGGASVDQYVAQTLGKDTRFPSLEFGVQTSAWGGNVQTRMSYAAAGRYVTPEDNPRNAYKRLFGAVAQGAGADLALLRKKSVIDLVRGELTDLRGRLGKDEQRKLDQHLDSLRQTERGVAGVDACASPTAPAEQDVYAHKSFPAVGKAQMDLLVTALACGMTRVASIQWAHTVAPQLFSWLGQGEGHHELSHKGDGDAAGVQRFVTCQRWFAEQFGYLIKALKGTPDPQGGTLLDSTVVMWCTELGDSRLHICQSVPFVLAGGGVRAGRYLRFKGAPHNQLLTSLCQAVGLTNTSFGDPSRGTGALEGVL